MGQKAYTFKSRLSLVYEEENPNAQETLFFIHGNSGSPATSEKQFNDVQFSRYRRIAIHLPGHGESPRAERPDEVTLQLGRQRFWWKPCQVWQMISLLFLLAFSYATNLIAEMVNLNLTPTGIVLCGVCCLGEEFGMDKVFKPLDALNVFFIMKKART